MYFISQIGWEIKGISRNDSFCAFSILPTSEDILVSEDTKKDHRFMDNQYVKFHPYIHFYAGVTLNVAGYKIGNLALLDTKPHAEFDENKRLNLKAIGALAIVLSYYYSLLVL